VEPSTGKERAETGEEHLQGTTEPAQDLV
jgi:hypothetical protein